MKPSDIIEQFRSEIDDAAEPYLWTTAELAEYLDDAQKKFCRDGVGVADVMTLALTEGTEWYAKNPRITKVRAASFTTPAWSHSPLAVVEYESFRRAGHHFDTRPGRTRMLVNGMRQNFFRATAVPHADATAELVVYRMPLSDITEDNADTVDFEIQEHFVQGLKLWMFARAYRKHDSDTFDPKKADTYENQFAEFCFVSARQQEKSDRQVGVVQYGGL